MNFVNSHRRRLKNPAAIIDFDGYGLTHLWVPFETTQHTNGALNYYAIRNTLDPNMVYLIRIDPEGKISANSPLYEIVNGSGTPANITVSELASLGGSYSVINFKAQQVNYNLTAVDGKVLVIQDGLIHLQNGYLAPFFTGTLNSGLLNNNEVSYTNSSNPWSVVVLAKNTDPTMFGAIFSTGDISIRNFFMYADRSSQMYHTHAYIDGGDSNIIRKLAVDDTDNYRVYIATIDPTTSTISIYLDGVFQRSITYSGNWINDCTRFGQRDNALKPLKGHLPMFGLANETWTQPKVTSITNQIKSIFNIS